LSCSAVQYRLALEYPFPAAYNDALEATKYMFDHADNFHADKHKIIVGGFSTGGGLAAAVCQALKKSFNYPIFHQLLFDGLYDATLSLRDYDEFDAQDLLLTRDSLKYQLAFYTPNKSQAKDMRCSPYWSDKFHGLPSSTMLLPEYSGIRSQGEAYAKKLKDAGVAINKVIIPGQTHNTPICRKVLSDGEDPAVVAGNALKKVIN